MGYISTFFKSIYSLFESLMGLIFLYVLFFMVGMMIPVGEKSTLGNHSIYIISNGVHTDICFPLSPSTFNWREVIKETDFQNVKNPKYISIGWGDKGFYFDTPTWNDLTFNTAFNAAFFPSETAMHVSYYQQEPTESSRCKRLMVNTGQYEKLIQYVCSSFKTEDEQMILIPEKGYGANDNFYEANGSYHLFNTCNTWTNCALKEIGIKTSLYALSAEGIMLWL